MESAHETNAEIQRCCIPKRNRPLICARTRNEYLTAFLYVFCSTKSPPIELSWTTNVFAILTSVAELKSGHQIYTQVYTPFLSYLGFWVLEWLYMQLTRHTSRIWRHSWQRDLCHSFLLASLFHWLELFHASSWWPVSVLGRVKGAALKLIKWSFGWYTHLRY